MTHYLSEYEVIGINQYVIQVVSPEKQVGVADPRLLVSAVRRPKMMVDDIDVYPSVFEKAAALFEALLKGRCFHAANMQTAFLAMVQFLNYNGYDIEMSPQTAIEFAEGVSRQNCSFEQIVDTIRRHSVPFELSTKDL